MKDVRYKQIKGKCPQVKVFLSMYPEDSRRIGE